MKKFPVILLSVFFLLCAADPSTGQQTINNSDLTADVLEKNFPTVGISAWEGAEFVFAPYPDGLRESGYVQVFPKSGEKRAAYDKYVGRVVKITKVTSAGSMYMLTLEAKDNGEQLSALALGGRLEGLVAMRDLNAAKANLAGKRVWVRSGGMGVYNSADVMGKEFVTISPTEAVRIVGFEPSWMPDAPIRVIVETSSGKRGFKDVSISGTNVSGNRQYNKFLDAFAISEDDIKSVTAARGKMCQEWKSFPATDFAWQKARFGMNGAEIEAAFGSEVKKSAVPDVYSGSYVDHKIPNLILAGQNFTVYFQMDSYTKCLSKILISPAKEGAKMSGSTAVETMRQLEQSLTEKYGQPQKLRDEAGKYGTYRRLLWKNGTTDIELDLTIFSSSSEPMLTIMYEPNNKKDSGKL